MPRGLFPPRRDRQPISQLWTWYEQKDVTTLGLWWMQNITHRGQVQIVESRGEGWRPFTVQFPHNRRELL